MTLGSAEFYELVKGFENSELAKGARLDKEDKSFWRKGHIYQHGEVNQLFRAFQLGYAYRECIERLG